ncbi:MAG: dehydrogenase [Geminicoccaceae bacterium]|nr:dehydrogenase [Geminicoccaceae bacterium]MCS7268411.1 dehydrogenase [Geminicoccaceae bacterium]MCX7631092.1 dehydrogenase [Geminicoccaceae bacterium]MDW8124936.1 dehydrogenase [Geminicoccaceae bacterium]MDW8340984.1 dehydrogenase [Geminicoccaceae bacterium]
MTKSGTSRSVRALWWVRPFAAALFEESLPEPGPGEVLVRTLCSGISRGTEALVAAGRVPASERERMRCPFQAGAFPFPVKYGYCAVGRIEEGPEALRGRPVFCLHPHQEAFVVPLAAVVPIPETVPPERAVLAANLETALNALWDGPALPGMRILVLGAGVVGACAARLCACLPGTEVTLSDRDPGARALAARLGCAFAPPPAVPSGQDLVIEATGSPEALAFALDAAGEEATILVLSWYGAGAAPVPLGGAFHSRRLRLVSSQVGAVAVGMRPRWPHARRLAKALELLADAAFDALLDETLAFADAPSRLPGLLREPRRGCLRLRYEP